MQWSNILFVDPMTDQEDYLEKHWSGDSIEQEFCVGSIEPYGEIGILA